jgi:hypothetical protein
MSVSDLNSSRRMGILAVAQLRMTASRACTGCSAKTVGLPVSSSDVAR